ncbi:MAG: CPBP family intramembrane metalloprotease [Deltaproteobacteria bacterium]|nr:CPBP family intramembrane metalloprotease [Deltaproteobacteria bacterium]
MSFLNSPFAKLAVSLVLLAALAPVVVLFFRKTWAELDREALLLREQRGDKSLLDARVVLTFVLGALSLLLINFYGSRDFYDGSVQPLLQRWSERHPGILDFGFYRDLYYRVFWGVSRYGAYLLPLVVWPFVFRESPLDLGLRFRGFREHCWIYLLCLVIVIPALVAVSYTPDFSRYYPMYPLAGRSWVDFWVWEIVYIGQFLALEIFFRGFWLRGARILGTGAIFSMMVPYVMIHFQKPYLEACGAIVAGVVLGSLSMRTGSIWAGFLIHSTVAILMDLLALQQSGRMPIRMFPSSLSLVRFTHTTTVLWSVWAASLVGLVLLLRRRRRRT